MAERGRDGGSLFATLRLPRLVGRPDREFVDRCVYGLANREGDDISDPSWRDAVFIMDLFASDRVLHTG